VSFEHWTVIKEGDDLLITRYHRSVQFAVHDLADDIAHRHETSAIPDTPMS
jgi:hypothetical protein